MDKKLFWTLGPNGDEILRNLEEENKEFTTNDYYNGKFCRFLLNDSHYF